MSNTELIAGVSETIITPPVGMWLLGPVAPSSGVHDDLFARVLVLSDGTQSIAIVCLDLIGTALAFSDAIRASIRQKTGIATTLLNCSHTHSAPFTIPWCQPWEQFQREGGAWREEVITKVTTAVEKAYATMRPIELHVGRAPAQVGINRRLMTEQGIIMTLNPEGVVVPWVDVLKVDNEDKPMALLFSHACHPVVVHAASTLISADYPGFAAAVVKQSLGERCMAMFAQGCGANINSEPFAAGIEAASKAGKKLGEAAIKAARESIPISSASIRTFSLALELPFQDLPPADACELLLTQCREQLSEAKRAGQNETESWQLSHDIWMREKQLARIKQGTLEPLRFEINGVAVGKEWYLLAMPHEVFADYQLWADRASPFPHTMVFGYTNGCESYIPTDADLALGKLGGYEASPAPSLGASGVCYRQRNALKVGVEGQIKKGLEQVWDVLRKETQG